MSHPPHHAAEAAGFVLAGGQSSRMGSDKALIQLDAEPLVVHALRILRNAGLPVMIAGARSDLSAYAPLIDDAGLGPLSGICAALASTSAEYGVFLPVDMPLLPPTVISALLHHARLTESAVTVPSVNGFAQTFPSVVQRAVLPALQAELSAGNDGSFFAFRAAAGHLNAPFTILTVENLVQAGQLEHPGNLPAAHWFLNVNTPADLDRAQSLVVDRRGHLIL
ncbi:MAG: molybdenum cofactor guanylyltransferase [Terracidiphilus sp.]